MEALGLQAQAATHRKLQELVDHGIFVVLRTTSFPPALPALEKTEDGWQPTRDTRSFSPFAHRGFTFDIERRKQDEQEHKARQERNQPPTSEVLEPAAGPGYRQATLGPHVGDGNESMVPGEETLPTYSDLAEMDPEYAGEETGRVWGTKVKYLDQVERQQYKLSIKDGRLFDESGNPFDTSGASSVFAGGSGSAIFVMDEQGNIYASKTQTVGKFHHSSFLAGKPVASAGEITVKDGYVKEITRRSGHYQPTEAQSMQVLTQLRTNGVDVSNIEITRGF